MVYPVLRDTEVMPELIREPSRVAAAGQPPKLIDEYVGRASTGQGSLSIAHIAARLAGLSPVSARSSTSLPSCCAGSWSWNQNRAS